MTSPKMRTSPPHQRSVVPWSHPKTAHHSCGNEESPPAVSNFTQNTWTSTEECGSVTFLRCYITSDLWWCCTFWRQRCTQQFSISVGVWMLWTAGSRQLCDCGREQAEFALQRFHMSKARALIFGMLYVKVNLDILRRHYMDNACETCILNS